MARSIAGKTFDTGLRGSASLMQPPGSGLWHATGLWIASGVQLAILIISTLIVWGGWNDQISTGFLAASTTASFLLVISVLMLRGWFASTVFLLFVFQPVFTVYTGHVWGDEIPVWPGIFVNSMMSDPIRLLFCHLQFMMLCMTVATAILPSKPRFVAAMPNMNVAGVGLTWFACGSLALLVLATALTTTRGDYVMDVQGGDRFFMVAGPLFIGMGAGLGLVFRNYSMKLLGAFCLFTALLIALSGYRSVFVFAATAFVTALLARRRLNWTALLLGAVGIVVAYQVMTYLSYLRANGVSLGDIISGSAPAAGWEDVSEKAGKAEQIAVFTVYYADKLDAYFGLTYLYAFVRSLPNALYTMFAIPPRIQDILVEGGPVQFGQVGLNLGAYFFAESILNFGAILAAAMTAFVVGGLAWVEHGRMKTTYRQMVYPVIVMLMPALALYGSTNFVKQLLTILTFLLLLQLVGVEKTGSGKRKKASAPSSQRASAA